MVLLPVAATDIANRLASVELRLFNDSESLRLVDLDDGCEPELQGYVPRLGGWTTIVTAGELRSRCAAAAV